MVDDVNPALRAELEAAKAILEPQIRGLHDLSHVSISPELNEEIQKQIEIRERRQNLIQTNIERLDSANAARADLERDGYPAIEESRLIEERFSELNNEISDLEAAARIFKPDRAKTVSVALGSASDKQPPQP